MPFANYSSEVPAIKSFREIEDMLVKHGAEHVMGDYENGEPMGISFVIKTVNGKLPFQLPANVAKVEVILRKRRKNFNNLWGQAKEAAIKHDCAQAKITAWRNLRDWTRSQLALIETDQVALDQVFFPYLSYRGKTVYQIFTEGNLLSPGQQDGDFREVKD